MEKWVYCDEEGRPLAVLYLPNGTQIDSVHIGKPALTYEQSEPDSWRVKAVAGHVSISYTPIAPPTILYANYFKLLRATVPDLILAGVLPDGTVGVPYEATILATGGTGALHWDAIALPDGLELLPNGEIIGTPTEAGRNFDVIIKVIDAETGEVVDFMDVISIAPDSLDTDTPDDADEEVPS